MSRFGLRFDATARDERDRRLWMRWTQTGCVCIIQKVTRATVGKGSAWRRRRVVGDEGVVEVLRQWREYGRGGSWNNLDQDTN